MIRLKESEANNLVILALADIGVKASKVILKENDNNVKCFLFYEKIVNGEIFEKISQIEYKNYLRLLSYGLKLSYKGGNNYGVSYIRKNS